MAELHAEGVVRSIFRLTDRVAVYMIVEAEDVEDARKQLDALVAGGPVKKGQTLMTEKMEPTLAINSGGAPRIRT